MKRLTGSGFTLLELAVVVSIVSILAAIALHRLLPLRVEAERVALLQVLGTLRSAMAIQISARIAKGNVNEVGELTGENPMADWLAEAPDNYLGELHAPDPGAVDKGAWYFDTKDRILVYRVRFGDYFRTALKGPKRARFRVELVFDDRDGNGVYDAAMDRIYGVKLVVLEKYQWLKQTEY